MSTNSTGATDNMDRVGEFLAWLDDDQTVTLRPHVTLFNVQWRGVSDVNAEGDLIYPQNQGDS